MKKKKKESLTSPPKSVSAGGPPLKYLPEAQAEVLNEGTVLKRLPGNLKNLLNSWEDIVFPQRLEIRPEVCRSFDDKHHVSHLVGARFTGRLHERRSGCKTTDRTHHYKIHDEDHEAFKGTRNLQESEAPT